MQALFIISYEKADPADFVATLTAAGVDTLVNVCEKAASRRLPRFTHLSSQPVCFSRITR